MSSGCNTNSCIDGCFERVSDVCVRYTGPDIEALGICTNQSLYEIEAIILQMLIDFSTGQGITIPEIDFTQCTYLQQYVACCSQDKSLTHLMEIIFDAICHFDAEITEIKTAITTLLNMTFTSRCLDLTNSPIKATIDAILVAICDIYDQLEALTTRVTEIEDTITTTIGDQVADMITTCQTGAITTTGTGPSTVITFGGFTPVGGIIEYDGPLNYFDNTGRGLSGTPMCGWALCNGNNGTRDKRGFVGVGAINGMGGGALNAIVDPNNNAGLGNYSAGDTGGKIRHQLSSAESGVRPHVHPIIDPGHFHYMHFRLDQAGGGQNGNTYIKADGRDVSSSDPNGGGYIYPVDRYIGITINEATTGVTVGNNTAASADQPHENRMPYKAAIYIQRIA